MSEFLMFTIVFITFGCILLFFTILLFLMYKEVVNLLKRPEVEKPLSISTEELARTPVEDVMRTDLVTIDAKTTIADAIKIMREEFVKYLPVLKNGRLTGVVTDGDVLAAIYNSKIDTEKITVDKIMTKKPVTIAHSANVREALDLVFKHKVRRLPVMRGSELAGLISLTDIEYYTGQPGTKIRGIHRDFFEG
jgi:CBS domain-containing protein